VNLAGPRPQSLHFKWRSEAQDIALERLRVVAVGNRSIEVFHGAIINQEIGQSQIIRLLKSRGVYARSTAGAAGMRYRHTPTTSH
jgi:hypothetical protein